MVAELGGATDMADLAARVKEVVCAGDEGEMVALCQRRYRCNCVIVIACDLYVGDSSMEYKVFEIYDALVSHGI